MEQAADLDARAFAWLAAEAKRVPVLIRYTDTENKYKVIVNARPTFADGPGQLAGRGDTLQDAILNAAKNK